MNIIEFLLSRIADAEAPTWKLLPYSCPPGCCAPAGYVGHACLICGTEEFGGTVALITEIAEKHDEEIHQRSRVLADCAAKRRIIGLCAYQLDERWVVPQYPVDPGFWGAEILLALSQPYRGHAEYDLWWDRDYA